MLYSIKVWSKHYIWKALVWSLVYIALALNFVGVWFINRAHDVAALARLGCTTRRD